MEPKQTTIFKYSATLLFGVAFFASAVHAGSLTLSITGLAGSGSYGSDAVSPYVMTVVKPAGGSNSILVACDDFNTHIGLNQTWSGDVFSLTSANLGNLKFSGSGLATYEEAAVIFTDLSSDLSLDVAGSVAIWSLFAGNVDPSSAPGAQAELDHAAAVVAAGGLNYSGIKIYTPDPLGSSQEFISGAVTAGVVTPASVLTPAPEPATYAMLGGGLILLGCARRRVRRS